MRLLSGFILAAFLFTAPARVEAAKGPIRWIENDWAKAQKAAKRSRRLIAVDVWATWCHTCLSMKNFVLTERPLRAVANKHVYLSMDYDLPDNAEFFRKFRITGFPTFLVIDPADDAIVARMVGSGSAEQMRDFFANAKKPAEETEDKILEGQRALASGDFISARQIFEKQIREDLTVTERTQVLSGYIESLYKVNPRSCALEGSKYLDDLEVSVPGIDYLMLVQYCSTKLREPLEKERIQKEVLKRLIAIEQSDIELSVDDRSALMGGIADGHDALEQKREGRKMTEKRLRFLERAAKETKNPKERATYDAHRLECYLAMRLFSEAEAMLKESQAALPEDFNPPWRLAKLYHARAETDKGLAAIDQALKLGYGGRRARLYATKIDLLIQKNDFSGAEAVLKSGLEEINAMDRAVVRSSWLTELKDKRKKIAAYRGESAKR